jgi:hypothetical protein
VTYRRQLADGRRGEEGGVGEGMGVLRQKGLLSQVDPALLSRVQQVIGEPKEVIYKGPGFLAVV